MSTTSEEYINWDLMIIFQLYKHYLKQNKLTQEEKLHYMKICWMMYFYWSIGNLFSRNLYYEHLNVLRITCII